MINQKSDKIWVEVNKTALTKNIEAFSRHVSGTSIMAVVKSNAYGHGLLQVAAIADRAGVAWFGVDNIDEALRLRNNNIKKPILILGYTRQNRLIDCIENDISFVVYGKETAKFLKKISYKNKKALVHLKIETGTSRQGLCGDELLKLVNILKDNPNVVIQGASTHYANIEDTTDHSYADSQYKRYIKEIDLLKKQGLDPEWKHTACSAAAILFPETHFNLIRLGISMYGMWPSKETLLSAKQNSCLLPLVPVLTWKTIVAQIKNLKKGSPVSYGLTERVTRNSIIAVIPVGYWDGFDRRLSNVGHVLIRGKKCKIIGRICMNMCMVDVTDIKTVSVEDEVVLLGKQGKEKIEAEEIASKIGTINYDVVTNINPMIQRIVH